MLDRLPKILFEHLKVSQNRRQWSGYSHKGLVYLERDRFKGSMLHIESESLPRLLGICLRGVGDGAPYNATAQEGSRVLEKDEVLMESKWTGRRCIVARSD